MKYFIIEKMGRKQEINKNKKSKLWSQQNLN